MCKGRHIFLSTDISRHTEMFLQTYLVITKEASNIELQLYKPLWVSSASDVSLF